MKNMKKNDFDKIALNTIRVLSCEMITEAKSGHPGIALGAAPIIYTLFKNHLVANPKKNFLNRDRFVMSAGHGSSLLYAVMHLAGYKDLPLSELKKFRKINSKTAGHPESHLVEGIDASTGPLGQGVGVSVGMAIAETKMREYFKDYNLVDYYTYCLFGDGCFQEGVSFEAFAIAGKLKLNKLIFLYDSNDVQLEGKVSDSTEIDNKKYFESLGLNYIKVKDGNDIDAINEAINQAKKSEQKPTVIEIKTKIGYGSVHENSPKAHGAALTEEELNKLKEKLNYKNSKFEISKEAYEAFNEFNSRGLKSYEIFENNLKKVKEKDEKKYKEIKKILDKELDVNPKIFEKDYDKKKDSTRNISGYVIGKICKENPLITLISPDISSSTKISYKDGGIYNPQNRLGINLNLGVREFLMGTIINGITSTGLKATGSTFLPFSDYCKSAIRLAAISCNPGVYVFSHDSIAVGEDGPTHEAIEQIWGLRLIPNNIVIRPSNYEEMIKAFELAFTSKDKCYTIITSRQEFDLYKGSIEKIHRGAYILKNEKTHECNIVSTGAEIAIAYSVAKILEEKYNVKSRVISMPSVELFNMQTSSYKATVLDNKPTISIEFGSTLPWAKFAQLSIGINSYGLSAPYSDILNEFKLNPENIAEKIIKFLKN